MFEAWARARSRPMAGATLEFVRLPGRTPLIFIDVPGDSDRHGLLYGHLDKQPEMVGWLDGYGPWQPRSTATSSTAAAAPMTAMRCSAP